MKRAKAPKIKKPKTSMSRWVSNGRKFVLNQKTKKLRIYKVKSK